MKHLCFYRDNSYFNDTDYFLMYDPSLKKLFLNQCEASTNGATYYSKYMKALDSRNMIWYNRAPLEYKMTSLACLNHNELIGLKVRYKDTGLTGTIAQHVVLNSFGVHWDKASSQDYRKWGFPYFWNDPNNLELLQ